MLLLVVVSVSAQLTYETVYVDYDSAWTYKDLKIIPIRKKGGGGDPGAGLGDIVPLKQALAQGLVTVTERGTTALENVHWLRFNTHSNKSVYISGGEIMAGGRQDRMVVRDTILRPSGKDQYVPVMCVEEGRWSDKEKKFGYGALANSHLRKVLDSTPNQVFVWREIDRQLDLGGFKTKTQAYLSRTLDKKLGKKYEMGEDDYFKWFYNKFQHTDSNVVGFVAISGDKVVGSDIFATRGIFYYQLEPLLHSYIDVVMMFGAPVTMKDAAIRHYNDELLKDQKSQDEFCRRNGMIFREGGQVVHVNTFLKEGM
ncbi:MAG TPA: DUF6569 family protein [Puia sp.]